MTNTTACRAAFEKWADDYGLIHEPNFSPMLRADCLAAFQSAWNTRVPEGEAVAFDRGYVKGYQSGLGAAANECRRIGHALDSGGNEYVRYFDAIKCAAAIGGLRPPELNELSGNSGGLPKVNELLGNSEEFNHPRGAAERTVKDYLTAEPEGEAVADPVGYFCFTSNDRTDIGQVHSMHKDDADVFPLYTHPRATSAEVERDAASAALRFGALIVELYDDATMHSDHMIDSSDCAAILNALADRPEIIDAALAKRGEVGS